MCAASLAMTQWQTGINDLNGGESLMSSPHQTAYKSRLLRWIEAYHWSASGVKLCILIRYTGSKITPTTLQKHFANIKNALGPFSISYLGKRILTARPLLTLTRTQPNFCWRWQVSRSSLETDSPCCIFAVPTDYWGRNLCCRDIWRMISRATLRGAQTSLVGNWALLPGQLPELEVPVMLSTLPTALPILTDRKEEKWNSKNFFLRNKLNYQL